MVLSGCGRGGSVGAAQDAFAFEGEFLAFEIEGGEFFNAGEDVFQDVGAGMGHGEFVGLFMEEVANGVLDARGLGEVGFLFEVGDVIKHFLGAIDQADGPEIGAEATEAGQ